MKVLIVEDEKAMAKEMSVFLEKAFYICDIAYTAGQAILLMEENQYDFILLDLGLPDKDGIQVLSDSKKYVRMPPTLY